MVTEISRFKDDKEMRKFIEFYRKLPEEKEVEYALVCARCKRRLDHRDLPRFVCVSKLTFVSLDTEEEIVDPHILCNDCYNELYEDSSGEA